jgi:hypothetical protein
VAHSLVRSMNVPSAFLLLIKLSNRSWNHMIIAIKKNVKWWICLVVYVQHRDDDPLGSGSLSVGENNKESLSFISLKGLESLLNILVTRNLKWSLESG